MSKASEPSVYYQKIQAADEDLQSALSALCDRQDNGTVSASDAAFERIALLDEHLQRCQALRRDHLEGNAP